MVADLNLPQNLAGKLTLDAPLDKLTWFRVGGPAQVLFEPADEADLAAFVKALDPALPVTVIGLGSNLLVRDGGVPGAVIRLGAPFAGINREDDNRMRAGAAAPDVKLAHAALKAGLQGLSFLRGIPGTIGGALRMNGGAYGRETADVLVEARAIARNGTSHVLTVEEMGYSYRHCAAPEDLIFVSGLFQGEPGDPEEIAVEMKEITRAREQSQPVRSRTGGSTFKNPPGAKAWELIDRAGCRGLAIGKARVSDKHCNFLINEGGARACEIEQLGELVRARVRDKTGVELEWEIRRIGVAGKDEP
jgi:UDP-N-acetylmuramate dehydrogenase